MRNLNYKSFIFFGAGTIGKKIVNNILMQNLNVAIDSFVDNDKEKDGNKIFDIEIHHTSKLNDIKTDEKVIVICNNYENEITKQLMDLGYKKGKDFVMYYEFYQYLEYLLVKAQVAFYDELKIIVGANQTFQKGWISTNQSYLDLLCKQDWEHLFGDKKITNIVAEHVWEHLTFEQGLLAAKNCYERLKDGGRLRIAVPDGNHPNPYYIKWVKPGGYGDAADDHKELYTYSKLEKLLKEAGFSQIKKLEYFDEIGNFHYVDWKNEDGYIKRSRENDPRNWNNKEVYTSLIIDAIK